MCRFFLDWFQLKQQPAQSDQDDLGDDDRLRCSKDWLSLLQTILQMAACRSSEHDQKVFPNESVWPAHPKSRQGL